MVGWPELPQAETSTTLSKCEGPRDVPNVEAENAGVEENALESRMRSCAPCDFLTASCGNLRVDIAVW